ncbi:MAG: VWA domain-containing protein [Deltaproteobacteria bacterium]|nr:VWA domain-containing protein [Deltaproteobacteria bacterium]
MPYTAEINRTNPSCFLFMIDQSGSMADPFGVGESNKRKAEGVTEAINNHLREIALKCARTDGVRDYFYIGVIGYGAQVGSAFTGPLAGKELVPISDVANLPARVEERVKFVEDGAGGLVDQKVRVPIWFDPIANGGTPMCQALSMGGRILKKFISDHPACFPPVVIHYTDGESTDGDPTVAMREIANLSSTDGNVLLFNCHVSSIRAEPIAFPHSHVGLPDQYARMLFNGASELTPIMCEFAENEYGLNLLPGAKGFTFNATLVLVIQALNIGTRPSLAQLR